MKLPMEPQPDRDFVDLVQRVLNHEASLDDIAHLNARLPRDPVALRYFAEMRMLHGALEDQFGSVARDLASIEGRLVEFPGTSATPAVVEAAPRPARRMPWRKLGVAAAAMIAISVGYVVIERILHPPAFEVVARHGAGLGAAPEIGAWIDCGDTLRLRDGALEIRSPDGNTLTFQGPGELRIDTAQRLDLISGRLWAELEGEPVLIQVPRGKVTDLGTTFGIDQSAPSVTRIDVFDGEVRFMKADDATRAVDAAEGECLISSGTEWTPEKGKADASRYTPGIRQPLGFAFVSDLAESERIESALAFEVAWTATSSAYGSTRLHSSPIRVAWVGSSIYSAGPAKSDEAAVMHTHLCGAAWTEGGGDLGQEARSLGLPDQGGGIVIQFRNLSEWLDELGASGYRVRLLRNTKDPGIRFLPVSAYTGNPSGGRPDSILESRSEDVRPADFPDSNDGEGSRMIQEFPSPFTADRLTLSVSGHEQGDLERRGGVSGVILTPVF
ncbi:hypothetical protein HAHE_29630 [Haloferula helveola]|uniref:FecR protein n=1 Tax=Haloferula helveola TaxID=490095 RepID=A0ABN6HCL5_9BACT|nr:hypothetical protein HAHE_29630 [Haloferula helveola]